jgi:hypothetical protein
LVPNFISVKSPFILKYLAQNICISVWKRLWTCHETDKYLKWVVSVQEVQEEGKHAIDSPGSPTAPDLPPEEYTLG